MNPVLWPDDMLTAAMKIVRAPQPPVDPVELAIARGHEAAIDLLLAIRAAKTPTRALEIQAMLKGLIQTLEQIELAALNKADDLNV